MFAMWSVVRTAPWLLLAMTRLTNAACECGYSVNKTTDEQYALFYDLQENDFLHSKGTNITEFGWRPQNYTVAAPVEDPDALNKTPYGKAFEVENVELNPLKDAQSWSGESEKGGDAGLKLWVRSDHGHGNIPSAELASMRNDTRYGSYRVGMKLGTGGTCGAFYWFYSNSSEIDMEFLSKDYNDTTGLVNLVLQSSDSALHKDAANTDTYTKAPLDFRPDQAFHEYRFDWTPDRVTFFVDGKPVSTMEKNVPKDGSLMTLNHWSNGNELWSAGPPAKDTAMTVSYVKAYFNSSSTAREDEYKKRCPIFDPAKVCQIPDQTSAPNGNNAKTYFFSQDGEGKTPGQETYKPTSGAAILFSSSISIYIGTSVFVAFFSWLLL